MALILPSSSTFITYSHKSHHHLPHRTTIKAQNSSSSSQESTESTDNTSSTPNSTTTPLGFGSSSVSTSSPSKKQKGKKERSRIIRREPVETPKFVSQQKEQGVSNEPGSNERAFLLAWLGLGSIIIVEGGTKQKMALILPSSSTFITYSHKSHHHLPHRTTIKAQNSSSSSQESTESTDNTSSTPNSTTTPLGFGSSSVSTSSPSKKQKGKKERSRIIRREPVETPKFVSQQKEQGVSNEPGSNERAFLLAWLGLGSIIIVEGIALAASGFLPEEWDALFVKYLYPSFTPTVFLFVAGTVVYGVVKYLENEKPNSSS